MSKKIINGVVQDNYVRDEHGYNFRPEWTAQQCVDELRRVAELIPDQFVTRTFFRKNSIISDATWDRYFGTMEEFRRQAGIQLHRGAHRMELHIARHASKDRYRAMNEEKAGYEDKYLMPASGRWQTVLGCNDIHDIECDPFWLRVFLDTVERVQPDKLVLNGDGFDLPEFGKYSVDPRTWDVVKRIRWMHTNFLGPIRQRAPNTEVIWIEGNHEYRLLRHLADQSPQMQVVLAELHGFTVPKLLGLDEFGVNYISRTDLAAEHKGDIKEELKRNFWIGYDCLAACHFPEGERMGLPGWNGHHHSYHAKTHYSPVFGTYQWSQFGAGHRRWAEYTTGEKWTNGFGLLHVDTVKKHVLTEYIDVRDFAVVGGRFYERSAAEAVFA
ncbi:metallophosphoesterase [Inquilinus limosus]|uniref:Calcineurin-like phosphoesterase domain-containing protein n=1 Tax=Inquilinus limosus MP06 TaxID=1398085 RepID=A0A0A0DBL9_9PROT|nr:metallophosphoesterase [Inquilinus limosus]KGM36116.1 hypothetical protein P409_00260 [Inquilinus limosus MP06]